MLTLPQLLAVTLAALIAGTATGQVLKRTGSSSAANINERIAAWWVLCVVTGTALMIGTGAVCVLFALFSSKALAEFVGGPKAAHIPLFVLTIAQYGLLLTPWRGVFPVLIPLVACFLPARECWGLMFATWCMSFAPALLTLDIPGYGGRGPTLLYYLLLVVESSDILQYIWGKLLGRHLIAPHISPNKTWEGLLGGVSSATALGTALFRATPFTAWQAPAICAAITLAGFAGGLTMSAIKRRRGIKDFGTIVKGHGGVLDRIDSLCFAAPVFFILVRQFFAFH